jgi:hypothetical protein
LFPHETSAVVPHSRVIVRQDGKTRQRLIRRCASGGRGWTTIKLRKDFVKFGHDLLKRILIGTVVRLHRGDFPAKVCQNKPSCKDYTPTPLNHLSICFALSAPPLVMWWLQRLTVSGPMFRHA